MKTPRKSFFIIVTLAIVGLGFARISSAASPLYWASDSEKQTAVGELQQTAVVLEQLRNHVANNAGGVTLEHREAGFLQANYWQLRQQYAAPVAARLSAIEQWLPTIETSDSNRTPEYGPEYTLHWNMRALCGQVEIDTGQADVEQRENARRKIVERMVPKCLQAIEQMLAKLDAWIPKGYGILDTLQAEDCYRWMYRLDLNVAALGELAGEGQIVDHHRYENSPFKRNRWQLLGDYRDGINEKVSALGRYTKVVATEGKRKEAAEPVDYIQRHLIDSVAYDSGYRTNSVGNQANELLASNYCPAARNMLAREMRVLEAHLGADRAAQIRGLVTDEYKLPEVPSTSLPEHGFAELPGNADLGQDGLLGETVQHGVTAVTLQAQPVQQP